MYVTAYMSRAQKFETKSKTDDKGEIKIEIKTAFDSITLGLSKAQAKDIMYRLNAELDVLPCPEEDDEEVPF